MRRVAALEIDTCPHCRMGRLRPVQLLLPKAVIAPNRASVLSSVTMSAVWH
ncbi:Zn-finger nucleic acid-binding protein [Hydrogenophaga palleronii]|uniref:Zn-finger nucleic acid-binding protein n=1 Tax=Hydrogenophaga palleronii TaxID=65655 RepID=A0ABU1WQT1_9BURK|nr:Zn-finger nucleic acid-binding protein [Hydrogenophaga palleronii]